MAKVAERVLVAGIGNIFFGDDGFGCEVVRRYAGGEVPQGVRVVDYGIRGMHLAYDLLEGWDLLILVDALPSRGATGTTGQVEVVSIGPEHFGDGDLDAHGMAPVAVLASLGSLGGELPPTILVGAQVGDIGDRIGLSADLEAAVPAALDAIQALLAAPSLPGIAAARQSVAAARQREHEEVG